MASMSLFERRTISCEHYTMNDLDTHFWLSVGFTKSEDNNSNIYDIEFLQCKYCSAKLYKDLNNGESHYLVGITGGSKCFTKDEKNN